MSVVADDGTVLHASVLVGEGSPDLAAVDAVARRALWAVRAGGRLVLADPVPELVELVLLAALPVVLEPRAPGARWPRGRPCSR